MILITDEEQALAERAAQYTIRGLKMTSGDHSKNITALEALCVRLNDKTHTNGVWLCKCPKWQQPTQASCDKCSTAKPS